jgi:hypothetical protein
LTARFCRRSEKEKEKVMSKTLKRYCRRETFAFALLGFAVIAIAVMFLTGTLGSAAGKPAMSTPIIACGGSGKTT